jgi:hypothetical protein
MYKLTDTYGAPQCTPEVLTFETWYEPTRKGRPGIAYRAAGYARP